MKGIGSLKAAVVLMASVVSLTHAQMIMSVDPPILGQSISRATVRLNVSNGDIADGLTITFSNDSFDVAHRGSLGV